VAQLIQTLSALRQTSTALPESGQATVIHARVGEIAFGTSPGDGVVMATLRAYQQGVMDRLAAKAAELAEATAEMYDLHLEMETVEVFPSTANDPGVVAVVEESAHNLAMEIEYRDIPFAWSEDFGHFTARHRGALFGLGAGESVPPLHHPEYDFPDGLIEPGVNLLETAARRLLEEADV
jgi:metal-dependent amidase/aminoacylase/carboxypeptidase family protein